ncbi:MAG: DinB family protein [Terriglobales bacterium]
MGDTTLRELVYGKGAHVDPVACVEDISAELAARTVDGYPHSIWQLVEHMNYWMDYDLAKVAGEIRPYPDKAIESWPAHPNPAAGSQAAAEAWRATTRRFADLLALLARLAESDPAALGRKVQMLGPKQSRRESTVHAILWQIAAHNSYHAGQIALLRRQAGAWPPERGGDTW